MQINPFESNPKGRRSPLFSSDEETENPPHQQNKLKPKKNPKDLNALLPGLLNSHESNNGRSEYDIQEVTKDQPPEQEYSDYVIPKFLISNKFATVKQFNKNYPNYSNDKSKGNSFHNNDDGFQIHTFKNSPFRVDGVEKDRSEPSSHHKSKRVVGKPTSNSGHHRRFSDSTENESFTEKIKSNRKYPSSYEEESIMDFYSDCSTNEPKITRLMTDYSDIQLIGTGSYGKVFRATKNVDKLQYAIKESIREFKGKNKVHCLNEAHALSAISRLSDDSYIVNYHSCWIDHGKFYLEMEYCPSSLVEQIKVKKLNFDELLNLIEQVTLAIKLLHKSQMVHLDIKPENILISRSGRYKLADLGQCHETNASLENIEEGDAKYLAPELLSFEQKVDLTKADIFSLGMSLFEIINGNLVGGEWKILKENDFEKLKRSVKIPGQLKSLLKSMLQEDPKLRPSAEDILKIIRNLQKSQVNLTKFLDEIKQDFLIREKRRRKTLP